MEFERITWVDIVIVIVLALLLAVAMTTSQADDAPSLLVPVPTPCRARGLTADAEVIKIVDGDTSIVVSNSIFGCVCWIAGPLNHEHWTSPKRAVGWLLKVTCWNWLMGKLCACSCPVQERWVRF